jgi:GTPase SAR1 family protein
MENMQLVIGMPSSGKSTFIAALGEVLLSGDVTSTLTIKALAETETHMVALQERWLTFQELGRTKTGEENWLSFHVISGENGNSSTLYLPDLSGESLRDAVVTGFYPEKLHQSFDSCGSILLFTNTNAPYDDILIPEIAELFRHEPTAIKTKEDTVIEGNDEKPFDPLEMPEQPKLVQLLQTIVKINPSRQRRLAVMLSAWDTVDQRRAPDDWFYEHRSMLSQYLKFNSRHWDVRIYGVSAQGGSLPQDKDKMQRILKASERVHIVGHGAAEHDLTAPIKWLMEDNSN